MGPRERASSVIDRLGIGRPSRTLLAAVAILVAVVVPCVSWYVVGRHDVEREAEVAERSTQLNAYKKGTIVAERLATRFEVLRQAESRRPFYHYQNLFHDPQGAAEGAAVSVSPLAHGPTDPIVEAHFQIDEEGSLTLPTLNEDFPELAYHDTVQSQCLLQEQLDELAVFCTQDLLRPLGERVVEGEVVPAVLTSSRGGEAGSAVRTELLDREAWEQHLQANAVYADLKYRGRDARESVPRPSGLDPVAIPVGPFEWFSLPFAGRPALVALRDVSTPVGSWIQGFVLDTEELAPYLDNPYETTFGPREDLTTRRSGDGARVVAPVDGTPWAVALDVTGELLAGRADADARRSRFLRSFGAGALAATLAGLFVVFLVHRAEKLARERAQFSAAAAHELRTPLAGLQLYGEMLAEGLGNPERARDYARRLAGEAERLGRVVTNVLSFTRMERNTLRLHPEPGDLAETVATSVARQRPALEEAGLEVEWVVDDDLPPAVFDRDAVGHIVQNLLDNAEKYTRGAEVRRARVELRRDGPGLVELAVSDAGPGIPRHLRKSLFTPFSRGADPEGDERDAPEGLGLGLVLVKTLTEAQGGTIRYQDGGIDGSGGARFVVRLPEAERRALPGRSDVA